MPGLNSAETGATACVLGENGCLLLEDALRGVVRQPCALPETQARNLPALAEEGNRHTRLLAKFIAVGGFVRRENRRI